jgi:hypothetical protein
MQLAKATETDSEFTMNTVVLDVSKIYVILHIFYNLDP